MPATSIAHGQPALSLIQTAQPGRFLGLVLAAGVGLSGFMPDPPSARGAALRLIPGGRNAA